MKTIIISIASAFLLATSTVPKTEIPPRIYAMQEIYTLYFVNYDTEEISVIYYSCFQGSSTSKNIFTIVETLKRGLAGKGFKYTRLPDIPEQFDFEIHLIIAGDMDYNPALMKLTPNPGQTVIMTYQTYHDKILGGRINGTNILNSDSMSYEKIMAFVDLIMERLFAVRKTV